MIYFQRGTPPVRMYIRTHWTFAPFLHPCLPRWYSYIEEYHQWEYFPPNTTRFDTHYCPGAKIFFMRDVTILCRTFYPGSNLRSTDSSPQHWPQYMYLYIYIYIGHPWMFSIYVYTISISVYIYTIYIISIALTTRILLCHPQWHFMYVYV